METAVSKTPAAVAEVRLGRIMIARAAVVCATLGLALLLQAQAAPTELGAFKAVYALIGARFALLAPEAWAAGRAGPGRSGRVAAAFFVADVVFLTPIVFLTGGLGSVFAFFYIFAVLGGSVALGRRGAYAAAGLAAAVIGGMTALEALGFASPRYDLAPGNGAPAIEMTAMNAVVLIAANLLVALLASHLVEEIRRRDTAMASSSERMRRLSALHTGIVQSLGSGVLTVDRDGRITSVNRAGAEILGFAEHELLLRPVEVAAPGFHKRIRSGELIDPCTGERGRWETAFPRRDGSERHLGFSASTLGVAGDPEAGHVVVFQDLTRIKDLERELALGDRLRSLGEMAAAIAHEIRNPLASMSGCIEMLRRDPEIASRGGRLLGIVVRESDRLSSLITDFLAYARPDRFVRESVSLGPLIDDLTHMLRESGEAPAEVAVRGECPPDLRVEGDAKRLHQMLWNVVKNALEALGGRGAIRIAAAARGEDWAVVTVEDDGPGIRPEDRERIFEPFFSTKSEGTGLGLALVHRIVEGHGGAVRVESSPVGTRFTIELPRGREGAGAAGAEARLG